MYKVFPTVHVCREKGVFKGRRIGTAKRVMGREDVVEAFVTSTEGTGWSDLQALGILSHTGPQFDPAAGDHPRQGRGMFVKRTSLLTSTSSTAGLILCRGTVSRILITH